MKPVNSQRAALAIDEDLAQIVAELSPQELRREAKRFRQWAEQLDALNGTPAATPKIPKGFMLINLSTSEQQELRNLSKIVGVELRDSLRWALTIMQQNLRASAKLKKETGLTNYEWSRLFGRTNQLN